MAKILITDDERSIRMAIREFAEFQGYEVAEAGSGQEALRMCQKEDFDLVIMDVMMPGMDGFSTLEQIKKIKDIPVIMLTAKSQEYDKLYGYELGVDDYVVKPFSVRELMARIKVVLRNHSGQKKAAPDTPDVLVSGPIELRLRSREVLIDGAPVDLRAKEFDLLSFLMQNKNIVFTRDQLLEKVWGYEYAGDDRTVDSQIKMLRRALGPCRDSIVTFRGVGYKFEDKKE